MVFVWMFSVMLSYQNECETMFAQFKTCCIWHWVKIGGQWLFTWSFVVHLMAIGLCQMSLIEIVAIRRSLYCNISEECFQENDFSSQTLWFADVESSNFWQYNIWSTHSLTLSRRYLAWRYFEIVWIVIIRTYEICEYQEWGRDHTW